MKKKNQAFGEPLRRRYKESQERPHALEQLGRSLMLVKKALSSYFAGEEKYNHLEKSEVERIARLAEDKQRWFEEKSNQLNTQKPTDDPVVYVSQIKDEKDVSFEN